jgi:hypothetical protein
MKMRLQNDSVRLRLTVKEVQQAGRGEAVFATTRFPGGRVLRYVLLPTAGTAMSAQFDGADLTMLVPEAEASAWADDETRVALRGRTTLPGGDRLDLLVEKDFACLVPRVGDDSGELFVNPAAAKPTP